jgi:hypothetical protein
MGWLDKLFGKKKRVVQEEFKENEEMSELKRIIEENSKAMQQMDSTIRRLETNLENTKNEVAVTIEEERTRIQEEKEREILEQEQKQVKFTQRLVSTYLVKYLDNFNIVNSRFTIVANASLLTDHDDLMFKIIQMIKLGHSKTEHVALWQDHIIRIQISRESVDIMYSIDGNKPLNRNLVGTSALKKFIQDLKADIYNVPCTQNNKIFRVKGKKYGYVLAKDEKQCFFIMKDKDFKSPIEEVQSIDSTAYVKSVKSHLIYSRKMF